MSQSLPHTDNFENVLVQLEGAKDIVLVPPAEGLLVYPGGGRRGAKATAQPLQPSGLPRPRSRSPPEVPAGEPRHRSTRRGDALYLPSFWWHHVRAGGPGGTSPVNFWYPTVSAAFRTAMDGMEADAY